MESRKVLIFAPEGWVAPHLHRMALIGRTLQEFGHDVYMVQCHGLFERCVPKDSLRIAPDVPAEAHRLVCDGCVNFVKSDAEAYGLKLISLSCSNTESYDRISFDAISRAPENLLNFEYGGIAFGKISFHDVCLFFKVLPDGEISDTVRLVWLSAIRTALSAYLHAVDLFRRMKFQNVLVFGQYAPNIAVVKAAEQSGVTARIVENSQHLSNNGRYMTIMSTESRELMMNYIDQWKAMRTVPMPVETVDEVALDIFQRSTGAGSHIYSASKTIADSDARDLIGLPKDKKLIVAYTSSLDEWYGQRELESAMGRKPHQHHPEIFPDQVSWLRHTIESVASRDDVHLVVRVHPREDANKRDSVRSQHLDLLVKEFKSVPKNVRFFWPKESVSSYDLMELSDAVLVSWSTIGMESARLGVPTMSPFHSAHGFPKLDFIDGATSVDEYTRKLGELLSLPPRLKQIVAAWRWYSIIRFGSAVFTGDVIDPQAPFDLPPFKLGKEARKLALFALDGNLAEQNFAEWSRRTSVEDRAAEVARIQQHLRSILHYFFTGERGGLDCGLTCEEVAIDYFNKVPLLTTPEHHALLRWSGGYCHYMRGDVSRTKYSPMLARIARIAGASPR